MKKYLALLGALFIFSLSPVVAQEATPEPTPPAVEEQPPVDEAPPVEEVPVIGIEEAAGMLLRAIFGAAAITAPITVTLVAIAKKVDKNQVLPSGTWAVVIGTLVTVITWLARRYGVETQINSVFELIVTAAPAVLSLLATLGIASGYYQLAVKAQTPGISYQRAPLAKAEWKDQGAVKEVPSSYEDFTHAQG